MGEGTNRMIGHAPVDEKTLNLTGAATVVKTDVAPGAAADGDEDLSPAKRTQLIEGEIDELRDELGVLVSELDRRRHEAMDVKLQIQRHAVPVALIGLGALAAVGALIAWRIHAKQERDRPMERARRLRIALERAAEHPDRVAAQDPTKVSQIGAKVLTVAATTAAIAVTKKLVDRAMLAPAKTAHTTAAAGYGRVEVKPVPTLH